jgi:hypothetical protein
MLDQIVKIVLTASLPAASFFSVSVSDDPAIIDGYVPVGDIKEEDVEQVKLWVLENKQKLLAVWHQQTSIRRAMLQSIASPCSVHIS